MSPSASFDQWLEVGPWRCKMAHSLTGDKKYRDSTYGHAYRFASKSGKQTRAKTGLKRLTGFLKTMIEAIADSKMRRIERELELRGYRYDRSNNEWVSCDSGRADTRKD